MNAPMKDAWFWMLLGLWCGWYTREIVQALNLEWKKHRWRKALRETRQKEGMHADKTDSQ